MIGTLRAVVLDAPDARRLAAFYTALGGWTEQDADDDWITMETGDRWRIAAQRSPDHVPPRWPDPAYSQHLHLDLRCRTSTPARRRPTCACSRRIKRPRSWT